MDGKEYLKPEEVALVRQYAGLAMQTFLSKALENNPVGVTKLSESDMYMIASDSFEMAEQMVEALVDSGYPNNGLPFEGEE